MTLGERLAPHGLALPAGHTLVSLAERPELWRPMNELNGSVWPEFMLHDPVAGEHWDRLLDPFAAFQAALFDPAGELVAAGNGAPLAWDGTDDGLPDGWEAQFLRSVEGFDSGVLPDTLGAIQVTVRPDRQGGGLSGVMLGAMRANARLHGYRALIACVRPTAKERYPLIPIERYARWTREDGLPFDPWLRVHVRLGGRIVRASPASMRYDAPLDSWREWTGMVFPESGEYLPQGAAAPVVADVETGRATYEDPNEWVVHAL